MRLFEGVERQNASLVPLRRCWRRSRNAHCAARQLRFLDNAAPCPETKAAILVICILLLKNSGRLETIYPMALTQKHDCHLSVVAKRRRHPCCQRGQNSFTENFLSISTLHLEHHNVSFVSLHFVAKTTSAFSVIRLVKWDNSCSLSPLLSIFFI